MASCNSEVDAVKTACPEPGTEESCDSAAHPLAQTCPLLVSGDVEADSTEKYEACSTNSIALVAGCVAFTEGFAATSIFPFCVDMTKELLGEGVPAGFYSGLLYTVNYTGMLLMQYPWMRLSDSFGRRTCLLVSMCLCLVCSLLAAFIDCFWTMVALRFVHGLLNASNTLARTSLREAFQFNRTDETWAFSQVSVAFAVSSLLGPSLGGLLYGQALALWPGQLPWTLPWLTVTLLHVVCFLIGLRFQSETAFLQRQPQANKSNSLCGDTNFILVLVMAWAHSYIFIGWETTYAALAELPAKKQGMEWSPRRVGTTFLVGGVAVITFSSYLYPKMVRKFTAMRVFTLSWIFSLLVLLLFPRGVTYLIAQGVDSKSSGVVIVNYAAQIVISTLLGSGFTSIQLIMNKYVATLPDNASQLASANGALATIQALARAMSPTLTGALFSAGMESSFMSKATTFDAMALLGVGTCLLSSRF